VQVQLIEDVLAALLRRGVELRFLPDLWPLRNAVVTSTLRFSVTLIRRFGDLAGPAVRPATRATPCPASGRYARTRRTPDRAATPPARSHDGDATNFAAATRSPPSC